LARIAFGETAEKQTSGGGGGDNRILDLRSREKHRIRILESFVETWRQYTLRFQNERDSNIVRFVVQRNGDLLSRKGFRSTRRNAVNVWSYDENRVCVLVGGPQIFNEFNAWKESGMDILASDVLITRSGAGRDTGYSVIRMDSSPFDQTVSPDDLHDLSFFDQAPSDEEVLRILGELEIDFDAIKLPTYTVDEAKVMEMPFGKHKGMPLGDLVADEPGWADWFIGQCEKNGDVGREIYIALKTLATNGEYDPNAFTLEGADAVNPSVVAGDSDTALETGENPQVVVAEVPETKAKDEKKSKSPATKKKAEKPAVKAEQETLLPEGALSDDELRSQIRAELTKEKWSDFRKVITLFEKNTNPVKHDVAKCERSELEAIWVEISE
jgi:uncharacterized protein (DUF3820 family)